MEHQDWKPVILRKKNTKAPPPKAPRNAKFKKMDSDDPDPPQTLNHSIKTCIQQGRVAKKMTQKQLAQELNLPVQTIAAYESGKAIHNKQILSKIGRVIGINLNKMKKN